MGAEMEIKKFLADCAEMKMKTSNIGLIGFLSGPVKHFLSARAGERFVSQGTEAGAWASHAPDTYWWRLWEGVDPEGPINVREGELMKLMTSGAQPEYRITPALGVQMDYPGTQAQNKSERMSYRMQQAAGLINKRTERPVVFVVAEDALAVSMMYVRFLNNQSLKVR
jgi:hypothetical protein